MNIEEHLYLPVRPGKLFMNLKFNLFIFLIVLPTNTYLLTS